MTGQIFGEMKVVALSPQRKSKRRTWECLCSCGKTVLVTTHDLRAGHCVSCGDSRHRVGRHFSDLTGMRIGWLTVLTPTSRRGKKGSVIWRCRCDCGRECEYTQDSLLHGGVVSCGCYRRTVNVQKAQSARHFIDGTCVEALQRKLRSDNTSGFAGVSVQSAKGWKANITFK